MAKPLMTGKITSFRDKTTKQYVLYIPKLEISGYGKTKKKAMEMLKYSLKEYNVWAYKNC